MMTPDGIAIVKALERLSDEVRGVRIALETFGPPAASVESVPMGCQHPIEKRIDFGITNQVEDWQCGVCGYRTTADLAVAGG